MRIAQKFMSYARPALLSLAVAAFGCASQTGVSRPSSRNDILTPVHPMVYGPKTNLPNGAILEEGAVRFMAGKYYVPGDGSATISGLEIRPEDPKREVQLFFDGKRHPEAETYLSLNAARGQAYIAGPLALKFQENNPLFPPELKEKWTFFNRVRQLEIVSQGNINFSIIKEDIFMHNNTIFNIPLSLIYINSSSNGSIAIKFSTLGWEMVTREMALKNESPPTIHHMLSIDNNGNVQLTSTSKGGAGMWSFRIEETSGDEIGPLEIYLSDNRDKKRRLKQFRIYNRIAGRRMVFSSPEEVYITPDFSPRELSDKPLLCVDGDRPDYVPYDPYLHGSSCSIEDAKKYYNTKVEEYKDRCEDRSQYKSHQEACNSIPLVAYRLGSHNLSHSLMDIIYYLDLYGINDFRSGQVIMEAANHPYMAELVSKKRALTMLYPASGSHMTPLLIPMKLMDRGLIDKARVIYTEINPKSEENVRAYLNFLEGRKVISNLRRKNLSDPNPGWVVRYDFNYRGKPIEFLFAFSRTHGNAEKYYSPFEYVEEADLIIFHDSFDREKRPEVANNILGILGSKPRLILADADTIWGLPRMTGELKITDNTYQTIYFGGYYGCRKYDFPKVHRYEPEDGRLVDKGPLVNGEGHFPNPQEIKRSGGALLIKIPPIK